MRISSTTASVRMMMRDNLGTIKGGGWLLISQCWIICEVDAPSGIGRLLLFGAFMESPSESSASSPKHRDVGEEIKDIKQKLKRMNRLLHFMDSEGGRRLENVDQDLIHLRKEFQLGFVRTEHVFIRFLA